jgi:hypothetical protein
MALVGEPVPSPILRGRGDEIHPILKGVRLVRDLVASHYIGDALFHGFIGRYLAMNILSVAADERKFFTPTR